MEETLAGWDVNAANQVSLTTDNGTNVILTVPYNANISTGMMLY